MSARGKKILSTGAAFAAMIICLSSAPPATRERIEAQVNDRILTSSELARVLRPIYHQYEEATSGQELAGIKKRAREYAISSWIEKQLILQEAEALENLTIDPLEVEQELKEARSRFSSPEEFEKALEQEGMTEQDLRKTIEDGLKVKILTFQKVSSKVIETSPGEILDYYQRNQSNYREPEKALVSYISISAPEDPAEREKARSTAQTILGKLQAGQDFETLAQEYSEEPGIMQGKSSDYFRKGDPDIDPRISEAVFSLSVGEHSPVIETEGAFHLIKVTGKKQPDQKPLEEVYDEISDELSRNKFQKLYDAWIAKLKETAYIVVEE